MTALAPIFEVFATILSCLVEAQQMQQSLESQTQKDRRNMQILNAIDPLNTYYLTQPKVAEFNPNKTTIGLRRVTATHQRSVSGVPNPILSSHDSYQSLREEAEKDSFSAFPQYVTS